MSEDINNNETATERRQREEYERAQLEKQGTGATQTVSAEQRQHEEWERAQKQRDTHDDQHQYEYEEVITAGKSINVKVVSQYWLDGLLRIISLLVLFVILTATIKTEFWSYSPLKTERAENIIVCWPIHTFYINDDYPGYDGRFSYLQKESLPPNIVKDYDVINKNVMRVINDKQSELYVKIKWGAYPVINAFEKMEIKFMASNKEQVCHRDYLEAQTIPLE